MAGALLQEILDITRCLQLSFSSQFSSWRCSKEKSTTVCPGFVCFPSAIEFNSSPLLRLWYQKIYQRNRENGKERVCGNSSYINTPSHSTSSQICPSGRLEGDLMALLELSSSVTLWCSSAGFEDVQLRLLSHCLFL